jgi:hypothetical protein
VHGRRVGKARGRQDDIEREAAVRVEAFVDVLEIQQTARDEAGAREKGQRHGDLRDDDRRADALMRAVGRGRAGSDPRRRRPARGLHRRKDAEQQRRQERRHTRERQDRHDEPDVRDARKDPWAHRAQQIQQPRRQKDAGDGSRRIENERLDDELPDQSSAAGAERRAHQHFRTAHGEARQQQARDVAARDQEHEEDRREQQVQRITNAPHRLLGERREDERRVPVRPGIRLPERPGDRSQFRRRGVARDTRIQLREHLHEPRVAVDGQLVGVRAAERQRYPELVPRALVREVRLHDAQHGQRPAVGRDGPADDGGIAAEAPLPERMAQDDQIVVPGGFIHRPEGTPQRRLRAEQVEELSADQMPDRELRIPVAREGEPVAHNPRDPHRTDLRLQIDEVEHRDARASGAAACLEQRVQAIGVRVRERPDQDAIDHGEHRRVDPDTDGERDRRRDGEERRAPQGPGGVPHVLERRLEPDPHVRFTGPIAQRRVVAQQPSRFASRGIGRHAIALEVRGPRLHVEAQLIVDVAIEGPPAKRVDQTPYPDHGRLPLREPEHTRDAFGHALPVALRFRQLAPPPDGQTVVLGAAIVLRRRPLRLQQTGGLEPMERRIQRAFLDPQQIVGGFVDLHEDSIPVPRARGERAQHEQVERAVGQRRLSLTHTLIARVRHRTRVVECEARLP